MADKTVEKVECPLCQGLGIESDEHEWPICDCPQCGGYGVVDKALL